MTKDADEPTGQVGTGYQVSAQTRQALIDAAGELFAEHGFEATSTRSIADKAGVKLGSIHYHFGSKEALYLAAFRMVCFGNDGERSPAEDLAEGFIHDSARPLRTAAHIWEVVQTESRMLMALDKPGWYSRLLMRGIIEHNPATALLVNEIFRPAHRRWSRLYQQVRPEAGTVEADLWAMNHGAFYVLFNLARETVCLVLERTALDAAFLDRAIRQTTAERICTLGLPLPPTLAIS